ncbi:cytochrome P450 87A3 [Herrania umbratica]|uniref:Cytochrome P450 87A3 n=1 Tax=Herrania umbratica TaxID=108875 RepID=A0A6J1AC36_9ROSI|nr:cytochrome P450 87A3 [Herrania umbratica]
MFQLLLDVGPHCHCLYAVLVLAALVFLASQLWKMLQQLNHESRADIPPGRLGLPFIGETIQFMAAINSGKGFYDFVRVRSLRYGNCFKTTVFLLFFVLIIDPSFEEGIEFPWTQGVESYTPETANPDKVIEAFATVGGSHKLDGLPNKSAITWMVKYLEENEDVLDAIKSRLSSFTSWEKSLKKLFLTLDDLNEMPYGSKVNKESLRMASVVPWFPRLVLQDCEIKGYKMKKGWTVNIDVTSIHLDPMVYSEPNSFDPSRFDDKSKPYSFLAFGMGTRTCLGMNMAKAMMLVFLHRLLTTYKWKVLDPDSSIDKWALFSRLRSGCPVHVTRL